MGRGADPPQDQRSQGSHLAAVRGRAAQGWVHRGLRIAPAFVVRKQGGEPASAPGAGKGSGAARGPRVDRLVSKADIVRSAQYYARRPLLHSSCGASGSGGCFLCFARSSRRSGATGRGRGSTQSGADVGTTTREDEQRPRGSWGERPAGCNQRGGLGNPRVIQGGPPSPCSRAAQRLRRQLVYTGLRFPRQGMRRGARAASGSTLSMPAVMVSGWGGKNSLRGRRGTLHTGSVQIHFAFVEAGAA
jgi:hypothetical protein